jgi:hypothetical protein
MQPTQQTPTTAIETPDDLLTILRDVSHVYELSGDLRRRLATLAIDDKATYQAVADAIGRNRSTAFYLVNDRKAA